MATFHRFAPYSIGDPTFVYSRRGCCGHILSTMDNPREDGQDASPHVSLTTKKILLLLSGPDL